MTDNLKDLGIDDTQIITTLPFDVLRNYSIEWNVGAAFDKDKYLFDLKGIITKEFEQPSPIHSAYGCPDFLWNGESKGYPVPKQGIDETVKLFHAQSMPLFITFTNPTITEKDLKDVSSNYILDKTAEHPKNGVFVTNQLLSDYIRKKYPDLKQFSSLTTVMSAPKRDKAFYEDLASRFDRVLIHPDDNFNTELLASLDNKNKFEIIVNMDCICDCPHHLKCLGLPKDFLEQDELEEFKDKNCIMYEKQLKILEGGENEKQLRNLNLTLEEVDEIASLGFHYFNIMGRGQAIIPFIYDLTRYTLEKDFIAPLLCKLMMSV